MAANDHLSHQFGPSTPVAWESSDYVTLEGEPRSDLYGTAYPKGGSGERNRWIADVDDYGPREASGGTGRFEMRVARPAHYCEDGECKHTVGYGLYQTQKRAQIAAEALVNRAASGRDMQTGRKDAPMRYFFESKRGMDDD
jgi:hypothetical protein